MAGLAAPKAFDPNQSEYPGVKIWGLPPFPCERHGPGCVSPNPPFATTGTVPFSAPPSSLSRRDFFKSELGHRQDSLIGFAMRTHKRGSRMRLVVLVSAVILTPAYGWTSAAQGSREAPVGNNRLERE